MKARKVLTVLLVATFFLMIQSIPNLIWSYQDNGENNTHEYIVSAPVGEQWEMTYGGPGEDMTSTIIEVPGEGFAAAGITDSFGAGGSDAWLVFLDEYGNVLNNFTYGTPSDDEVTDIIKVSTGGYAMVGRQGPTGSCDLWLLQVDDFGGVSRSEIYGSGVADYGEAIIETSDGCFLMVGWSSNGADHDLLLTKINTTDGLVVWSYTYGGLDMDIGYDVVETSDGYVAVGTTQSWGAGGVDMWLVKVDTAGIHQWNETFGGASYDAGFGITYGVSGGFALAGTCNPGPGPYYDAWLVFTDENGTELSSHTYGGSGDDRAYSITQTHTSDGYVMTGDTNSIGEGSMDFYTIRTDLDGTLVWDVSNGSLLWDTASSITYLSDGGFILTGNTEVSGSDWDMRANRLWYDTEAPDFTNLPASVQLGENEPVSFQVIATEYSGYRYWQLNDTKFSVTYYGLITNTTPLDVGVYPVRVTAMDKYYNVNSGDVTFTIGTPTTTSSTTTTTTTTTTTSPTTTTTPTSTTPTTTDTLPPIDPEAIEGLGLMLLGLGGAGTGLALWGYAKFMRGTTKTVTKKEK